MTSTDLKRVETALERKYTGKYVSISIPGKTTVMGMVQRTSYDSVRNLFIFFMKTDKYELSPESIDLIKIISNGHS